MCAGPRSKGVSCPNGAQVTPKRALPAPPRRVTVNPCSPIVRPSIDQSSTSRAPTTKGPICRRGGGGVVVGGGAATSAIGGGAVAGGGGTGGAETGGANTSVVS